MTGNSNDTGNIENLLKTMIIVQLGIAGVPQANIRRIIGGDINRINAVLKNIKSKSRAKKDTGDKS